MKANRKFIEEEAGVSAVIGVILMVAITVAIAATVYVYVSGMIGTAPEKTPTIIFSKSDAENHLMVTGSDQKDLLWTNVDIIATNTSDGNVYTNYTDPTGTISAADKIMFGDFQGTVTMVWIPTDQLMGTWKFT